MGSENRVALSVNRRKIMPFNDYALGKGAREEGRIVFLGIL